MEPIYWLIPAFFVVALVYSMAGFAGGSSYLALLALGGLNYLSLPPISLVCNIIVASSAFYFFHRAGHFSWRNTVPFMVTSIPFAYLGGQMPISNELFVWLLSASLIIAGFRLFLSDRSVSAKKSPSRLVLFLAGPLIGILLGFWSGVVGIGGGILLSPLLLLLGWAGSKEAAAASSFFILVNSMAGLAGHLTKGTFDGTFLIPLALAVFLGGQIGSRLGTQVISRPILQKITAALLLVVALRLVTS